MGLGCYEVAHAGVGGGGFPQRDPYLGAGALGPADLLGVTRGEFCPVTMAWS